ncbi:MAG: UPF0147 family protein [Thermoplasmata archaeon]|nr:UPF0147 family protein [Thermoplasmata archaeon]
MNAPASATAAAPAAPISAAVPDPRVERLQRIVETLVQLSDDSSVPRNVRRGALSAKEELTKLKSPMDVRIASAVYVLDDLANDPNIPTHGRTAIWTIVSSLESFQ